MKHRSEYKFDGVDPAAALAIVAPGSLEDMLAYTRAYKARGVPYIFDPGQSIPAWGGDDLQEMAMGPRPSSSMTTNWRCSSKKPAWMRKVLLGLTPTLITTRGDAGSYLRTAAGREDFPVVQPSRVQDPTGAGDAYRAGLLKGLTLGLSWSESIRMGIVLASFCVQEQGTQEHRVELYQFWERYQQAFGTPPVQQMKCSAGGDQPTARGKLSGRPNGVALFIRVQGLGDIGSALWLSGTGKASMDDAPTAHLTAAR